MCHALGGSLLLKIPIINFNLQTHHTFLKPISREVYENSIYSRDIMQFSILVFGICKKMACLAAA